MTPAPDLPPPTVPEVRRLLRHQARARRCHYNRRLARAQEEVRL